MKQGLGFGKGFVAGVFVLALLISLVGFALALVPNPGHSWNEIECNNVLCVSNTDNKVTMGVGGGKVGIGVSSPEYSLHLMTLNDDTVVKIAGQHGKAHGIHITDLNDVGFAIAKGDNNLFIDWSTKVGDSSVAPRRVLTITP
ncbi:hypothetical protein D6817_04735, partial [Candidatus Pacearchaeota archaeon]